MFETLCLVPGLIGLIFIFIYQVYLVWQEPQVLKQTPLTFFTEEEKKPPRLELPTPDLDKMWIEKSSWIDAKKSVFTLGAAGIILILMAFVQLFIQDNIDTDLDRLSTQLACAASASIQLLIALILWQVNVRKKGTSRQFALIVTGGLMLTTFTILFVMKPVFVPALHMRFTTFALIFMLVSLMPFALIYSMVFSYHRNYLDQVFTNWRGRKETKEIE